MGERKAKGPDPRARQPEVVQRVDTRLYMNRLHGPGQASPP